MARHTAALLVCCAVFAQIAVAQYGNVAGMGGAFDRGTGSASGDRLLLSNITLPELKGVWRTVGSQQSAATYAATNSSTMPDCAADNGQYSYNGLDTTADQYFVLAGTDGVNRIIANQQRTGYLPNVTYDRGLILGLNRNTTTCTNFMPFVDLATGELMAESISMTQWTVNTSSTTNTPSRTNLNCQVTGNELPGCYIAEVSRSGATMPPSMAPSVSISSIALPPVAARPDGSIVTVTKTTYACGNGECLRLAPKYASASPRYGG